MRYAARNISDAQVASAAVLWHQRLTRAGPGLDRCMFCMTGMTSQIWQVEEAPRASGPSELVLSASRALARRVEDSQPFTKENVELHWKDREATLFDFYFNHFHQTLKVDRRHPESQPTYPARLARLTSKPATPATPSTRATASPSSRLTTPQTPRTKTPTSPDSRGFKLSQGHFELSILSYLFTSFHAGIASHTMACCLDEF